MIATMRFDQRFGHLAWKQPLSRYRLRIEYRFVGQQAPGGPAWALRNSGVMLHGQPPATMGKDQSFPVSLEVQFLGGLGKGPRTTANVCTPGTHVVMDGQLITKHCTNSRSRTHDGDGWVTVEIEVDGGKSIKHLVDGQVVLEYGQPQLDDKDADARDAAAEARRQAAARGLHLPAGREPPGGVPPGGDDAARPELDDHRGGPRRLRAAPIATRAMPPSSSRWFMRTTDTWWDSTLSTR